MMKMLRRGIEVKLLVRSFKSSSYSPTNFSNKYKNLLMKVNDPPFLVNYGKGYFAMLPASVVHNPRRRDPPFWVQFPYNFVVSGPCHGLFCLYTVNGHVALWNPGTGDIKNLISEEEQDDQQIEIQNLGFGFDSNANDYTIVRSVTRRFLNPYYKSVDHIIHQIEIYTLKTNQWREIPVVGQIRSLLPYILSPALFADGACYWTVPWDEEDEDFKKRLLISFDFAQEEFHLGFLPPSANGFGSFQLFNLNGWPAAFGCKVQAIHHHRDDDDDDAMYGSIHVWMRMPVNGVKTWIKQKEVGPLIFNLWGTHFDGDDHHVVRPLCLWQNRRLVALTDKNELVYYDLSSNDCNYSDVFEQVCLEPDVLQCIEYPPIQFLSFPASFLPNPW